MSAKERDVRGTQTHARGFYPFSFSLSGLGRRWVRQRDKTADWRVSLKWAIPGFCVEPVVTWGRPSPALPHVRCERCMSEPTKAGGKPCVTKPSGLVRLVGGLGRSAAPYSCTAGYSRERHVRPTDIKPSSHPDGSARSFPRPGRARWRGGPTPSRSRDPLADGQHPACPGAPFILMPSCPCAKVLSLF